MFRINFLIFWSIFVVVFPANGQMLSGLVLDSATGAPLSGASVFINSSSIGTMTADSGTFQISTKQLAEFDLIISYVGYQIASIHITHPALSQVVLMAKREESLDEVTVTAAEKNGWKRWGALFKKHFIGTTTASRYCSIVHPELIRFYFSKKSQLLSASAATPLTVINRYLGYQIDFELTKFEIDFNTQRVVYKGFPRFSQLPGNASRRKGWMKNRKEVYFGSFMHFLRTVHNGSLNKSPYEVHRVLERENTERTRVRLLTGNFDSAILRKYSHDSSYYYERIQTEPDVLHYLAADRLSDVQFIKTDSDQVFLNFEGMIYVLYKLKKQEKEYSDQVVLALRNNYVSGLVKLLHQPVLITPTGQYFPPDDVLLDGYWGWSEKVANQLPVDYLEPAESRTKLEADMVTKVDVK